MFHLRISYRSRDGGTSCDAARQYIAREGRFRQRGDIVRTVSSIHMPEWAGGRSAEVYWAAAEGEHTRVNARTAVLVEFALPRDLSTADQNALALEMAEAVSRLTSPANPGDQHFPVTFAIHEGRGWNPHVHMLVSTSINDQIARSEEQWFRRYSRKAPERGGAQRSSFITKKNWLYKVRELWASLANATLITNGLLGDLDHRSNASRGLLRAPSVHLGPRLAELASKGVMTPRIARNKAAAKENEELAKLEAEDFQRKQVVRQLEREAELLARNHHVWSAGWDHIWEEALGGHPLRGDAQDLRSEGTLVVLEADEANRELVRGAYERIVAGRITLEVAGAAWDIVKADKRVWLVRPTEDTVVMLAPGYAATDASDDQGLSTLVHLVKTLPFNKPVVIARDTLMEKVEGLMQKIGLNWRLRSLASRRPSKPRL